MRISAKADYAVRAAIALAEPGWEGPMKGDRIADGQGIPIRFLENILGELRNAGIVQSQRGTEGGYWLARSADRITVDGPLATVRGERPEDLDYLGDAQPLQDVWVALRARIREVLETVTLHDVVTGSLPKPVGELVDRPDAWEPH